MQVVYSVPGIGFIQVKATEKAMNIVHSDPNIDSYNKSLQSFNSREVATNVSSLLPYPYMKYGRINGICNK